MSIFRAAIGFPWDSALPRDVIQITPHFNGDNPQALANALKTNLQAVPIIATSKPFKIKIYDAQAPPPSYPLATAEQAITPAPTSGAPRELAICLSYYAQYNRPSLRGRLYIPFSLIGGTPALRPTGAMMNSVLSFAGVFMNGLPASHHWVIWSRKLREAENVTNWWVDDEWDIIRTRGLRPTTRVLGP